MIVVFMSAGAKAEAMKPNAYHKAKHWDDDDHGGVED